MEADEPASAAPAADAPAPTETVERQRDASPERTRVSSPAREPEEEENKQETRTKRFGPASPGHEPQERRSKRRRSASPPRREIDIYRPDYRRDEPPRRGPPPGRGYGQQRGDDFRDPHFNPAFRNGPPHRPPAPEELPYLVLFRQFCDFHRDTRSPIADSKDALESAYQKYRSDFTARQLALFFEEHRGKAWFRERYDPSMEELRLRVKAQGREGKVDQFLASLASNILTDLSYDLPAANGAETNGDAVTNVEPKMDEDGVELVEGPKDAEKPDSSLPNKPETKDDHAKDGKEEEFVLIAPAPNQLFIKSISPDIERVSLENHCASVQGYSYLALSEPNHTRRFQRVGWVSFAAGTDMDAALAQLGESKLSLPDSELFTLHMHLSSKPTYQKLRIAPGIFNERERLEKDLQQASQLVQRLEGELGDNRGSVAISAHFDSLREAAQAAMSELPEESKASIMSGIVKRQLDATLYYLRNVFNTCYYCTCVCDYPEELLQRCAKHLRRPQGAEAPKTRGSDQRKRKPNDQAFARRLDERISLLVSPDDVDPRDHGGKNPQEELHRLCTPYIKSEDESKYRCLVDSCGKAFKGATFAEKHIANKHADLISSQVERVRYFNNYVLDPDRILPPAPDTPAGGGFNGPPSGLREGGYGPRNGDYGSSGPRNRQPRPPRPPPRNDRANRDAVDARERFIDSLPPPAPPKGVALDPRANRGNSNAYTDLDASNISGDLELDY